MASAVAVTHAVDWTQYRGPNHNGVSTENIRTNWTEEPPRLLWKRALEPALSSFAIAGSRAYTQVRRPSANGEQEFCVALDAGTGNELWATPLGVADYPNGGVGSDDGPRSTPSVDGDRVYVLTSYLRIACLDAATGQEVWSKDLVPEFGGQVIPWQNAASPLVVGDLVYMNCNAPGKRLLALRKTDGSVAWQGQDDAMTQATPVAATIAGAPQVIFFAQSGLVSVAPESGAVLWRFPTRYSTSTAASPVVAEDAVYCSAAYGVGGGVVRITRANEAFTTQEVWRTRGDKMNHWATPVYHEGHFYGIYGQSLLRLQCIERDTAQEKWSQPGVGYGSVLLVAGHLLVLTESGEVVLVKPDPTAYTELARFQAVQGRCWNAPAISGGRIFVRSTTEAAAYDVTPETVLPPPKIPLRIQPVMTAGASAFSVRVANEDGSALDTTRALKIDILATSDLASDPVEWSWLTMPVLTNGQLVVEDPFSSSSPQRFYKAQERP